MRSGFGAAAMVDDFEHLIDEMTCDTKDRHVLAAAVAGGAGTLVTFNLKDFPEASTAGHGIDVVHPDIFLTRLLIENTDEVLQALNATTARLRRPPTATRDFLASLTGVAPIFSLRRLGARRRARVPSPGKPARR
jgi:hypothetical protein